ncbi:SRPBCC family protein [Emticicia sp. CRIBPO]|uniref:SRPBCC family protein n=1 Tax=Emticicia sp. CRIBPO TaxID=2683258 RepID=UPI00197ACA4E|nr:SRPBCC family protein [Emticicia sp. CRIBPO]
MTNITGPVITCQMLIRKPASEVFNAFIDPSVTTNFWFTKSSGSLTAGQSVTWEWEMYGASAPVSVKEIVDNQLIRIEWGDPATTVEFEFNDRKDDTTYVIIRSYGFKQEGEELISVIIDNTGGFTTVLDGLKAWLEHGLRLNLIGDKFAGGK